MSVQRRAHKRAARMAAQIDTAITMLDGLVSGGAVRDGGTGTTQETGESAIQGFGFGDNVSIVKLSLERT
jgi:hypothetical protein